jgi:hypothetical protein
MPKIFVSWYDGQNHSVANEFFRLLQTHGFEVEHSPHSPESGWDDKRWSSWYRKGLPEAIQQADIFVAVITSSCDGSSWMQQEYQQAYSNFLKTAKPLLSFIRLDSPEHPVKYQEYYLSSSVHLSSVPEEAVQMLLSFDS